jgi:TolB-like protein/DNA-binding winged helix-turn-helix (wHTH) protein
MSRMSRPSMEVMRQPSALGLWKSRTRDENARWRTETGPGGSAPPARMTAVNPSPPARPDPPPRIELGGFVLDLERRTLLDARGNVVELRPQAYEVLRLLATRAGSLVTKKELIDAVWPGVVVTDDSLVQAISDVRQALGEAGRRVLKTLPRRGYMLLVPDAPAAAPAAEGAAVGRPPAGRPFAAYALAAAVLVLIAFGLWQRLAPTVPEAADAGRRPSIAVLPFKGLAGEPEGDALARDVAAELVSELARSPDLRVVSSQSSFRFADRQTPLSEIGRQLRSRYVVDGTVRRDGEQLRMAVELIDSVDGQVAWSSSQVVDRSTLGAAQQALVGRIAGTLQARVARSEQRRAVAAPPKSLDAYVLVARGRAVLQRHSAQGVRESRRLFEQALALDPDYAAAWAFLAIANVVDIGLHLTGEWDYGRTGEVLVQARRAIELQPELPIGYFALAQAQALAGDFDAMHAAAKRFCELSPNDADCFFILGVAQTRLGDVDRAVRNFEAALDRNPFPPTQVPAFYATALWAGRRPAEALRVADDCLAKAPEFWRCRQDRIAALVDLGRLAEAREEGDRLRARMPGMTAAQFGAGFAATASALRDRRVAAARAAGFASQGVTADPAAAGGSVPAR